MGGIANHAEVYLLSVPTAGDYLFKYVTWYGTFYIPFRCTEGVSILVNLNYGDNVLEAAVSKGTITSQTVVYRTNNGVLQVFGALPYVGDPAAVFATTETTPLVYGGYDSALEGRPPWIGWCNSWDVCWPDRWYDGY